MKHHKLKVSFNVLIRKSSGIWDEGNISINDSKFLPQGPFNLFRKLITFQNSHFSINQNSSIEGNNISVIVSFKFGDVFHLFDLQNCLLIFPLGFWIKVIDQ